MVTKVYPNKPVSLDPLPPTPIPPPDGHWSFSYDDIELYDTERLFATFKQVAVTMIPIDHHEHHRRARLQFSTSLTSNKWDGPFRFQFLFRDSDHRPLYTTEAEHQPNCECSMDQFFYGYSIEIIDDANAILGFTKDIQLLVTLKQPGWHPCPPLAVEK
jgi:hypothetical protein